MKLSRSTFNWISGTVAAILGLLSLYVALDNNIYSSSCDRACVGRFLSGFWVVVPPVFFWIDWVVFCRGLSAPDREVAKHTHDLSRNIWLALVAILAAVFGIKLGGA
jgi:hypothetical protein